MAQGEAFALRPGSGVRAGDKEHRRFTLSCLQDFAVDASVECIHKELAILQASIDKTQNESLDSRDLLEPALLNVLCHILFGCRLASEEPKLIQMLTALSQHKQTLYQRSLLLSLNNSWLGYFSSYLKKYTQTRQESTEWQQLLELCQKKVEEHQEAFQQDSEPRNFIENLLQRLPGDSLTTKQTIGAVLADLLEQGTEAISSALRWALLYMLQYPQAAQKVVREIHVEIGVERLPTPSDRARLNYTAAVLEEVLRLASPVANSEARQSTRDCPIGKHQIPSGSLVHTNIFAIHRDPTTFTDPSDFKPERFIDKQGFFRAMDSVIPFGIGKRSCLGENLARTELFLVFTALMQRYSMELDSQDGSISAQKLIKSPTSGYDVIRTPKPYKIKFRAHATRQENNVSSNHN